MQGNTIVVLKALGQENIDDLLKLSEDYKKSEFTGPLASVELAADPAIQASLNLLPDGPRRAT